MSCDKQPPDKTEVDRIARMAKESGDFFKGLAQSLEPKQGRKAARAQQPNEGANAK